MVKTTLNGSEALAKFYENKFYFSYSGLNKLLYSPAMFYSHYVLNEREDRTDAHLVGGRVLHCLLFEPDTYDDNFTSLPGKLPTDSQRKIIDIIFKNHLEIKNESLTLDDYSQDILTQLLYANLYQSLKDTKDGTGDEKRLKKILTQENKDYFEFLKHSQNRTVVDTPTLDSCKVQVEILKNNDDVRALLQLDKTEEDTHITVYNELRHKMDHDKLPFGLHGIIDNAVVDTDSKTIFITDLKTTGKSVGDFPDAVEYYRYWIQGAMYFMLAADKFLKDLPEKETWDIKVTFIVIDKYNLVYPYQVSDKTMRTWNEDFIDILMTANWHYDNKRYDLPYKLAKGNFKL